MSISREFMSSSRYYSYIHRFIFKYHNKIGERVPKVTFTEGCNRGKKNFLREKSIYDY